MRRRTSPAPSPLAALGGLAALALAAGTLGCSDGGEGAGPDRPHGDGPGGTPAEAPPRLDIDPRSFYEDYEVAADQDMAAAAPSAAPAPAPATGDSATAFAESAEAGQAADVGAGTDGVTAREAPPVGDDVVGPPVEPGVTEDNVFVGPGASPFLATASEPRSTFGFDVDTGSYTVGRTFLDQGLLPPAESVRTEEWVNAFGYTDPPPADDAEGAAADLAVSVAGGPAPFALDGTRLLRVGVHARPVAEDDRPDANLTFVVDTSGSMDIRERLGLVRSTLALLALELRDTDTVSVVTYGDTSNVLLPPTPAAEAESIVAVLDDLVPQGSTNMEAGLRAGYAQARASYEPEDINTVVLASDGVANTGITGTDPLSDLVREEGAEGIRLVTVGYGMGNYDDDLMEQLADRGDGFYGYVDTYEEAERLFTGELTSTLTVVADEARAQVAFDPAAVSEFRLVGYENRALADEQFRDDAADTGELGAGHVVSALYELRLVDGGPDRLGTVTVRHRPAGADEAVEQEVPITADALADDADAVDRDVALAGTVAAFAEVLGQHPVSTGRGVTLEAVASLVDELAATYPPVDGGAPDAAGPDAAGPDAGETDGVVDPGGVGAGRPGIGELADMVALAQAAGGSGGAEPGPVPGPVPLPRPVPTVTTG